MTIDALLRDSAPDATHVRLQAERIRGDVLARAVAQRLDRNPRRRRATVAAAIAAATVGLGGVAYATNGVPGVVTSAVGQFAEDVGVADSARPDMVQIVDLTLPDGSRFAAWAGSSAEMSCTAYTDNWNGEDVVNGGKACGDAPGIGNGRYIAWAEAQDKSTYYPVIFGGGVDGATEVHITGVFSGTGRAVDLTLPIDPASGAFSAVLLGTSDHPWDRRDGERPFVPSGLSLSFVDANGTVRSTVKGPLI